MIALSLALGGVAFAIEDTVEYTGCLTTAGTLINVSPGEEPAQPCSPAHMQVSWNQTGPKGDQGPQGPEGPQGPPGSDSPMHLVSTLLSPNEIQTVDFGNGFTLELRCDQFANGELWVMRTDGGQWYDNAAGSATNQLRGPAHRYGLANAQGSPGSGQVQIGSAIAYIVGLDGTVLQMDRVDVIVRRDLDCRFGGFVAAG